MKLYPVLLSCCIWPLLCGCTTPVVSNANSAQFAPRSAMLETPQGAVDVTVVQEKTRAGGATARTGYSVQSVAPASGPAVVVARAQSLWARPLPAEPAAFAHTLAAHLELPPAKVAQALDQAQYNPDVVRLMTPRSARTGRPI